MKHLILFDIDGTLLRARGAGKLAFERAFVELFQIENAWEGMNPHGRTDRDIIEELSLSALGRQLTEQEQSQLEQRFIRYFDEIIWSHDSFETMPGVLSFVDLLSAHPDVFLAIETGNLEATAQIKLRRGQLDKYFSVGGYGSDSKSRAEIVQLAIQRARASFSLANDLSVTVIGDSSNDILAAHENRARAIGVGTGGVSAEVLRKETEADLIVETLENKDLLLSFILGE